MKKGKARSIIMLSKTDNTVTSLNNLTDDITILSNDNANIQVTTEGQAIKIDSTQVSANKADIATNFNKYLAGIQNDGTCNKNNDCNKTVVNGRWYSNGTKNDPNAPTETNGILETYRPTTETVYQKYTPYTSANTSINLFYQRSGTDASTKVVWSEWVEFSTEQTATNTAAIATNKTDIATNFNKYLAGLGTDGTCNNNNDCNKTVVNGRWYSNGTKNDPNAPTETNGILETYRPTTETVYQKYTPYTSANISINLFYQRRGTNVDTKVVWSEWVEFSTEQTATNTAAIATNKTDIATNFNKYLEGYDDDGNFDKSIDCNKSINNGTWYCPTSTLNIPAECIDINASGYLEVTRATTLSLRQIFTPYGDSHSKKNLFWIRTAHDSTKKFADDTFEPWVKFGSFDQYLAGLGTDGTCNRNNDCNKTVVNGRWFSDGTPNDPNAPTGSNGILETYRPTTGSVYQKYTPYTSANTAINRFFQRSGTDASTKVVWSEWVEFSTEQTAISRELLWSGSISTTTTLVLSKKITDYSEVMLVLNHVGNGHYTTIVLNTTDIIKLQIGYLDAGGENANRDYGMYLKSINANRKTINTYIGYHGSKMKLEYIYGLSITSIAKINDIPIYIFGNHSIYLRNFIVSKDVDFSKYATLIKPNEELPNKVQVFKNDKWAYKTDPYPEHRDYCKWVEEIGYELDVSKKDNLISVISKKVKDQTNINMEASKWIRATEEQEFEDAEIHMQFVNIENALDFTDTLASKTMEELIALLITDKFNI